MSNSAVCLDGVCFSYEKNMVLKKLSAEIAEKRICFIMGNNGSGKTTLLKNIMGFLSPQSGKILINGNDIKNLDYRSMSKLVSYVPQVIRLNADFKVMDYLALGRTPYGGLLNRLADSDYEVIERYALRFGIDCLDIEFNKLSGGQKQMIAIVRSLIQDTPIIIMDEPLSALDIGKQVDILKAFRDLTNEGKTIIMTTHNPNHALSVDSDACFLDNGQIVAYGNSGEIMNETILQKIYGSNIVLDHGSHDFVVFDINTYQVSD